MKLLRFLLIILFALPGTAFADVVISEIMYDLDGSDSGYEWIEIHNTGSSSVNIASWYFRENDVNHGLTADGQESLEPAGRMLIVQNIEQFESRYGTGFDLLRSSFSLNNTGETLALADANKDIVFSYSYSSDQGAAGDGNSLQYLSGQWKAGEPSPGTENNHNPVTADNDGDNQDDSGDQEDNSNASSNTSDTITLKDKRKKQAFEDYYEPYINFPEHITANIPVRFRIGVFHIREYKRIHEKGGSYFVNFGDGSSRSADERIDYEHTYSAPGSYVVSFEYYSSQLKDDYDQEPDVLYQKRIEVNESDIRIDGHDGYGSLVISNETNHDIDMSGWHIKGGPKDFSFDNYSIIQAHTKMSLSHDILGFIVHKDIVTQLYLTSSDGHFIHKMSQYQVQENSALVGPAMSSDKQTDVVSAVTIDPNIQLGENTVYLDEFLAKNPGKQEVSFENFQQQTESLQEDKSSESDRWYFASGLGALAVTAAILRYLQQRHQHKRKEDDIEGEIELVDV